MSGPRRRKAQDRVAEFWNPTGMVLLPLSARRRLGASTSGPTWRRCALPLQLSPPGKVPRPPRSAPKASGSCYSGSSQLSASGQHSSLLVQASGQQPKQVCEMPCRCKKRMLCCGTRRPSCLWLRVRLAFQRNGCCHCYPAEIGARLGCSDPGTPRETIHALAAHRGCCSALSD